MSLVLYSGGHYRDNEALNRICLGLTSKRHPRITFIPSNSEYGLEDFRDFVEAFDTIKKCHFVYFPVDYPFTEEMRMRAMESDIIFLSGGNTFYFLRNLRTTGLLKNLKDFHRQGKILAGLSAGAILLTPNISTASFPKFDCDENYVGLKNFNSLKLAPLEFFPHYVHTERYRRALCSASRKTRYPLFAVPDGSGIIYSENELRILGSSYLFNKGQLISLARAKPSSKKVPSSLWSLSL